MIIVGEHRENFFFFSEGFSMDHNYGIILGKILIKILYNNLKKKEKIRKIVINQRNIKFYVILKS